jgi:RimJ/RimL family protein N-acetyltransferase
VRFGPDFREAHALKSGDTVVLRMIRPSDRDALRDALRRLSPESRYRRFLAPLGDPTEEMLRYLCEVDGVDHVAIIAVKDSLDLKTEDAIGVARFVRLHGEGDVAEAAVTVGDAFQGRGLGTLLLATLAGAASERGIRKFRGEVLASNAPVRHLLEEVGAEIKDTGDVTITFDVPLADKEGSMRKLLHAAGTRMGEFLHRMTLRGPGTRSAR